MRTGGGRRRRVRDGPGRRRRRCRGARARRGRGRRARPGRRCAAAVAPARGHRRRARRRHRSVHRAAPRLRGLAGDDDPEGRGAGGDGQEDPAPQRGAAPGAARARRRLHVPGLRAAHEPAAPPRRRLGVGRDDVGARRGVAVPGVPREGARRGLGRHSGARRCARGPPPGGGRAARRGGRAHAGADGDARCAAAEVPVRSAGRRGPVGPGIGSANRIEPGTGTRVAGGAGVGVGSGGGVGVRRATVRLRGRGRELPRRTASGSRWRPRRGRLREAGLPARTRGASEASSGELRRDPVPGPGRPRPPPATARRSGALRGCSPSRRSGRRPRTTRAPTAASARRATCRGGS